LITFVPLIGGFGVSVAQVAFTVALAVLFTAFGVTRFAPFRIVALKQAVGARTLI